MFENIDKRDLLLILLISISFMIYKAQQPFIDLVDIILAKKERNEDTALEEAEIDRMVYELYGLTEEEISIIERGT